MHLVALSFDLILNVLLIRNPGLFLLHKPISDALNLSSDWVQSIIVILDSVLFFLDDGTFKFIPNLQKRFDFDDSILTFSSGCGSKCL